jgi:hypothetical protein
MSDFLAPPGITAAGLDAAAASRANDPASQLRGALNATYAPVSGSPNYETPSHAAGVSAALSIVFGG